MAFCVSWRSSPIAFSTCEGSSVPDEHADPVDTATPSRSSAIRSDSASMPSNPTFDVLATRGEPAPLTCVPGTAPTMPCSSRSRSAAMRGGLASRCASAWSAATPRPTMAGRFSVPARRFFSWRPPVICAARRDPAPNPQGADALRAIELVPGEREQIDAQAANRYRDLAGALDRVGVDEGAARAAQAPRVPLTG